MPASLTGKISGVPARAVAGMAFWHTQWQWRRFRRGLADCRSVQEQLLLRMLRANEDSDFGRQHGFARIRTCWDFARAVPLSRYPYFAPYIARCQEGDTAALFGPSQKLLMFALTSGTTAAAKHIPITASFIAAYRHGWNLWGLKNLADHPNGYARKLLQISSPLGRERTAGGYSCGPVSAALARYQKRIVRHFYALPRGVTAIEDPHARHYATARFAIAEDIGSIITANPSTLVLLAETVEHKAERVIQDVHDGTLDPSIELPAELRSRLLHRARPNRRRSRHLQRLLDTHGRLLPRHYWNPAVLAHWTGGTVGLYLPKVRQYYGKTPIRDIGLLASEGRMSIPLEDNTPAGVLDLGANFYEFIPAEQLRPSDEQAESPTLPQDVTVLRAHELEEGQQYFILLTNYAGLYRYHIGDMVRVTNHVGTTPVIEFLSRGAHTSSVTGEKLTEHQVVTAVNTILRESDLHASTFTMAPVWAEPPYYAICLENSEAWAAEILARLAQGIDESLGRLNGEYQSKRQSRRLGPVQARQTTARSGGDNNHSRLPICNRNHEQCKHRFLRSEPLFPSNEPNMPSDNARTGK